MKKVKCTLQKNTLIKSLIMILAFAITGCSNSSNAEDDKASENSVIEIQDADETVTKDVDIGEKENFFNFYVKFYTDEDFQMERVTFPLPGENKQDMGVLDTIYYWKKDDWRFLEFDQFGFTEDYQKCLYFEFSKGKVIEEYTAEKYPGFVFIREFKKKEGKWHLVYMVEAL